MTCLESVQKKIDFKPEVALILGSGLGDFADGIQIEQTIDYTDIEGCLLYTSPSPRDS